MRKHKRCFNCVKLLNRICSGHPVACTYYEPTPPVDHEEPPQGKETNPKDSVGIKKVPVSTLPWGPILEAGLAMMEGARKYGRHNYRVAGVRASVYFDAVVGRHLVPWYEGTDIDPDSGLNHVTKAIAGLLVLRDSMLSGNWIDDRPPRNLVDLKALNEKAAEIVERYPDAKPAFTQKETT